MITCTADPGDLGNNPRLILADEPTASRDTARRKKIMELLKIIPEENQPAVIVVTLDVRMIEGFDFGYQVKDGHLNHQGSGYSVWAPPRKKREK